MTSVETTKRKVKEMLANRLKLGAAAEKLSDDVPLFGEGGFGLDSIDALEVVLGLQKDFGVAIDDRELAIRVLRSVSTIAAYIEEQGKG
jgi:acyl carrier protein